MYTIYKNSLGRIKADDTLKDNTAAYLLDKLNQHPGTAVRSRPSPLRRLAAAACALVLFCGLSAGGYAWYRTPVSYLSIDINPSVELGINAFGRVVTVTAYNEDGQSILESLTLDNLAVDKAVGLLVESASQNGFILEDGSSVISITAETNNERTALQLQQDAKEGAEAVLADDDEDEDATILTDQVALEQRDEAIALGITPGKLNLIQKLQALDPTIATEDYKDLSVKEIQKKYVELKKELKDTGSADIAPEASASPSLPVVPETVTPAPDAAASPSDKPNGNSGNNGNKPDKPDTGDNQNTQSPKTDGQDDNSVGNGNGNGDTGKPDSDKDDKHDNENKPGNNGSGQDKKDGQNGGHNTNNGGGKKD